MPREPLTPSEYPGAAFQGDGRECCTDCGGSIAGGGVETIGGGTRCWTCEGRLNGDLADTEDEYG